MSDEQQKEASKIYEIKIQGQLDAKWSEWLYDMAIEQDGDVTYPARLAPRPDGFAQRAGQDPGYEPAVDICQSNYIRWTSNE